MEHIRRIQFTKLEKILLSILVSSVLILLVLFIVFINRKHSQLVSYTESTMDMSKWHEYKSTALGISLKIPSEWQIDEKRDENNNLLEVVFRPSKKSTTLGNITFISVSKTPVNPEEKQLFTVLYNLKNNTQTKEITKIESLVTDEYKRIIYLDDTYSNENRFKLIAWLANDDEAYKVTTIGGGKINIDDIYALKFLLSQMKSI